ncbi:squalene/phytoene synthase family protein [Ovoidimarina sediminis]|uniref:squalene/phytoene synthase family protein n=1 Tax=Ovoidimarina sediminis TaxID=3079856 RepID=UPI00290F4535|nr:squalene/phytoene synthase family protein [Rhodophyticola sp. MJ-SS7]MDU8941995.1 squalene/phytoene synthase family protein [Rhodophyticola sp. MJ-SS7]
MSIEACTALVGTGDPDRFAAAMAAPVPARRVLFPIYAFNLEVARAPWVTAEPMIAEMRLQWWRDVLTEIGEDGPVRRHEVATPLAEAIGPDTALILAGVVDGRLWDIHDKGFDDTAALWSHLDRTGGTLMWASAHALGAPAETEQLIRNLGTATALASWFQAIPALEARGKHPLPDGRPGAVQMLAREGRQRLAAARRSRHGIPRAARPALYAAWQAGPLLARAAARPETVADGTLALSEFRRRAGLLACGLLGRW